MRKYSEFALTPQTLLCELLRQVIELLLLVSHVTVELALDYLNHMLLMLHLRDALLQLEYFVVVLLVHLKEFIPNILLELAESNFQVAHLFLHDIEEGAASG